MAIIYDEKKQVFYLHTKNTSYIFGIFKNKELIHIHYGKKIVEPGYFSGEAVDGKRIFDTRYDLKFVQEGNTYTLFSALDLENGQQETRALELDFQEVTYQKDLLQNVSTSFFPLDALADCEKNYAGHNEYYGMRFDFEFSLGNYVGPMTFRFVGDDDLWVFVDGNPVLDLGGIHSAYPKEYSETPESNEVDLWSKVFAINTAEDNWYTSEAYRQLDKTEKHQVTVLYMERGGVDAACFMQFVMPDVTCIESVIQKPALLELTKVDSKTGEALGGAVFRLTKYTDDACQTVDTSFGVNGSTEVVSSDKGKLRFENLGEGYYQLMETKAPEGYYLSTDKWKLVASMEEDGTVRIDAEGLTDGRIENVPLELVLDSSKSASLVDWEKRIYQVNLAAFAKEKTISTTRDANVLLLVDASGSMIFTDALISAQQLDPGKIYFTKPFVSTENNTYGKAWRVSSEVRKRLLETAFSDGSCYGIPSTGEYLFYVEDGEQSGWYKKDIRYLGNRAWWERDESLTLTNAVKTDPAQLSLYTNRSELFVDAAVQFVNGLSENSKVAVVTFGNEGAASKKTDFVSLQSGREQVLHAIRQAVGVYWTGTYAGNGFSQAADMFEKLGDDEDSYMVFFTDGEIDDPNQTRRASAALKEDGVKIYAIGVGEGNSDILYDVATSKAYVKTCDNMTDVANALTSLGLSAPGTVENVQMVDEISDCFELCNQEGLPVTSLEGAEISYREGRQVITWNRQTLAIGGEGLHKTIYIRAKDCFAGGNFIPTNGQFVVTFPDGKTTEQPTPYVNVRTSVRAGKAEDTIFLGESLQSYFTTEQETAVSGVTYDAHGKVIALVGENGAEYTNLDYVHVSVSWKDEKGNAVTPEDIRSKAPTEETNFFATVTVSPKFAPDSPEAQAAAESMQANPDEVLHVVETMQAEPDGIYTVKVLNGQITVTKKIKKAEIDYKDGDPIFTFRVEKDGRTQTRMVRFTKETVKSLTPDADGYISLQVRFDNLSKGVYRVEELSTLGYQPESANVDRENTSCAFSETKDGIWFAIGQQSMEDTSMKPEAVQGACCYVNKAQNTNREMDKDMVVNQVVMENGRVVIQPRTIPEQN